MGVCGKGRNIFRSCRPGHSQVVGRAYACQLCEYIQSELCLLTWGSARSSLAFFRGEGWRSFYFLWVLPPCTGVLFGFTSLFYPLKDQLTRHLPLLSEFCICMDPGLTLYPNSGYCFNFSHNSDKCTIPWSPFCHLFYEAVPVVLTLSWINLPLKLNSHSAAWKRIMHMHTHTQTNLIFILFQGFDGYWRNSSLYKWEYMSYPTEQR